MAKLDSKPILHRYSHIGEELNDPYYEALWDKSEASILRYKHILFTIKSNLSNPRVTKLERLNNVIHSYLITLLISSYIGDQGRTSITPHFNKLIKYNPEFNIRNLYPSTPYVKSLVDDRLCTWGGPFGTITYFLHLVQMKKEYLTPSQITSLSIRTCVKFNTLNPKFPIDSLTEYEDYISNYPLQILEIEDIKKAFNLLDKLVNILPLILNWYLGSYMSRGIPNPPASPIPSSNEYEAYKTLADIGKLLMSRGLDGKSGLTSYDLIHQSLPPIWTSTIEDVIAIRENTLYDINFNNETPHENLCRQLIGSISRGNQGVIRKANYQILNNMFPPGGYNLLLLITALALVNRAYILTFPPNEPTTQDINKALGAIYKAGICLRKSNLNHLMLIGNNLTQLSNKSDNSPINIKDPRYE